MKKISVIIPVYNAAKTLKACVNSVLSQTFKEFELILVNDGSKDNSLDICKSYEKEDNRIIVLNKENGGANSARALGVRTATGEFINFIDSDDEIPTTSLEDLYKKATSKKLDIVQSATTFYSQKTGREVVSKFPQTGTFSSDKFIEKLFKSECDGGPHGNLYKLCLFDDDTFNLPPDVKLGEDFYMNLCLGIKANRIGIFNDIICYKYIENKESVTHTYRFLSILPQQHQLEAIEYILNKYNLFDKYAPLFYSKALSTLSSAVFHNRNLIKDKYIKEIGEKSKKNVLSKRDKLLSFMLRKPCVYPLFYVANLIRKKTSAF